MNQSVSSVLFEQYIRDEDRMPGYGIAVYASNKKQFVEQAVALAISVKLNSPSVPVALVTNMSLKAWQERQFAKVFYVDFRSYPGISYRFAFDLLAPFSAGNLILDSDTLVYQNLEAYLHRLLDFGTTSFQYPGKTGCHWFKNPEKATQLDLVKRLPLLNGDAHFVIPDLKTQALFAKIRELAGRYDEIGIRRWRGGLNDEPVFSMAYREMDWELLNRRLDILGNTAASSCVTFRSNCKKGNVEIKLDGEHGWIKSKSLHFESFAFRPSYKFEQAYLLGSGRYPRSVLGQWIYQICFLLKAAFKLLVVALRRRLRHLTTARSDVYGSLA